jgi:hypothetical protein
VTITVLFVFEMVGGLRVSGTIAASWGKRGKTTSKPVAIPLLMLVTLIIVAVTMMVVLEMERRTRVSGRIATSWMIALALTMMFMVEMVRRLRVSGIIAASRRIVLAMTIIAVTMMFVVEMVRRLRVSGVIAKSWGKIPLFMIVALVVIVAEMLVLEMVGRVRVSGGIAASGRERRKTASQPVAVPLLMIAIAVGVILVFKMVRGLGVYGITTASRRKLGKISRLMLTEILVLEMVRGLWSRRMLKNIPLLMLLVLEMVRGLWVSAITPASRRKLRKIPLLMLLVLEVMRGLRVSALISASRDPLLDGIGGRRRDEPHQGDERDKHDEKLLHFEKAVTLLSEQAQRGYRRGRTVSFVKEWTRDEKRGGVGDRKRGRGRKIH